MSTAPTLICIPDISGFTQFMSAADIELSSTVIPSLLNKVIYANDIGLKVSEIEGDAILFYKNGKLPTLKKLVDQCKLFYTEFYKQLHELHLEHKDEKGGNKIPEILGLKIILHYGKEVSAVPIGKNIKLMGEDVIIAHRLLKNDIKSDEYILVSQNILDEYPKQEIEDFFDWGKVGEDEAHYKHIGDVAYRYINLSPLVD